LARLPQDSLSARWASWKIARGKAMVMRLHLGERLVQTLRPARTCGKTRPSGLGHLSCSATLSSPAWRRKLTKRAGCFRRLWV
jgi:hypothetical protein